MSSSATPLSARIPAQRDETTSWTVAYVAVSGAPAALVPSFVGTRETVLTTARERRHQAAQVVSHVRERVVADLGVLVPERVSVSVWPVKMTGEVFLDGRLVARVDVSPQSVVGGR